MAKPNLTDRSDGLSRALRSEAIWASFSPAIKELYLEENLPGWLLEDIMRTLYDFRASPRVYRERFPKKDNENNGIQPIRGRTRQKVKDEMVTKLHVMCARPFLFKTPLRPQPAPLRYRPQEKIMYSIHHFLDSMFIFKGKHTWSTNHVGFLSPAGEAPQLSAWQLIESCCDSASTSIRCNQLSQARDTLYGINHLFDLLARLPDPLFLGKIWRLALVLHGLDRRAPLLKARSTILRRLKATACTAQGLDSPISIIVSCLLDVDEADFTPTMRLGFHETLVILDRKINDENITMLQMWSTYARYFSRRQSKLIKRKSSHPTPQNQPRSQMKARRKKQSETPPQERLKDHISKDILMGKFSQVWHKCWNEQYLPVNQWRASDVCVLITQHYAYAAFWLCDKQYLGVGMAMNIIEDTKPEIDKHPVWSVKTIAFSVASKIVATYHHHRGEVDQSEEVLDDAIKTLSHGDNLCLSKAMRICLTLASWRRERGDLPGSQEAEMRLLAIQDSIQGVRKCPDCRPSLKCQGCFDESRANCRNCNKPASEKKRTSCLTCKTAGSSRRRVIRLKTELWTSHGLIPIAVSSSQESRENLPLRKGNLTSDQFSITGLPKSLTVHDILRAIRNTGRVFSSRLTQSSEDPQTSTFYISFFDTTSVKSFWEKHRDVGLQLGDHYGSVHQSDSRDSMHGRMMSSRVKGTWIPSRVLIISGLAKPKESEECPEVEMQEIREETTNEVTMGEFPRLTQNHILERFRAVCDFQLDEIILLDSGDTSYTIEVRFSSWKREAVVCMNKYRLEWKKFGITMSYGTDPCD